MSVVPGTIYAAARRGSSGQRTGATIPLVETDHALVVSAGPEVEFIRGGNPGRTHRLPRSEFAGRYFVVSTRPPSDLLRQAKGGDPR